MVKVAADSKDYSVSDTVNSEDYTIVKTEGDTAYIALDFLQKYANFDYEVYKDPARVVITSKFGERQTAKVKDDSQVRILGGVKSPVLEVRNLCPCQAADKAQTEDQIQACVLNRGAKGNGLISLLFGLFLKVGDSCIHVGDLNGQPPGAVFHAGCVGHTVQ